MNRRVTVLTLSLTMIAAGVLAGVFLFQPTRGPPSILVKGGYLVDTFHDSAVVHATDLSLSITLTWNNQHGVGLFIINVTNIDTKRTVAESDAQVILTGVGYSSESFHIRATALQAQLNLRHMPSDSLRFYVFGDSQGYQGGVQQIVFSANENRPDFLFHCGDITPFGQDSQYISFIHAIHNLTIPLFTTAGNHDIRLGGDSRYVQHFGPPTYSFDSGFAHFTVLDTSNGDVSNETFAWLEHDLMESSAEWKIVFTHIPPFDPRPGENHTLSSDATGERLMSLLSTSGVDVVFAGHIHIFNDSIRNGGRYVITGGAGAGICATTEGGLYHYVNVTLQSSGLTMNVVPLNPPVLDRSTITIRGTSETMTISLEDLAKLTSISGSSSFQNQYGNWGGQGAYKGVRVAELLDMIGGVTANALLSVSAFDGYEERYSYWNVYPNDSWHMIQGDMIIAYEFNGTAVPIWSDGPRIVMLAPDGAYSNDDCLATSAPGLGFHVYPSAGALWVRYVMLLEVIPE